MTAAAWLFVMAISNVATAWIVYLYAVTRPVCPAPHAHIGPRRPDQEPLRLTVIDADGSRRNVADG